MTPAETIQAAIDKLEALKQTAATYEVQGEWLVDNVGHHTCGGYGEGSGWLHEPGCGYEPLTNDPIIVTLHRTIDAQLAILRDAATLSAGRDVDTIVGGTRHVITIGVDLARAILGGAA